MKKSILYALGLFTLIACSEDSYQEADTMNKTGSVETAEPQNSIKTVDTSVPYESPYGTADRFTYVFQNDTPFDFTFTPWVQLCFYDGINDNIHFGTNLSGISLFSSVLSPPSSNEYSIYLGARTIKMPAYTTETISMGGGILPANPGGPKTASGQYFNFDFSTLSSIPPPTATDINFYTKFLKFVGLEGSVRDSSTGLTVAGATLRFPFGQHMSSFNFTTPPAANWTPVPMGYPTAEQKYFNTVSKEVCATDVVSGSIAGRPSYKVFSYNGINYSISLYTEKDKIVVLLK